MNNSERGSTHTVTLVSLMVRMRQIEKLALICAPCHLQRQSNASQTLCDIIRLSRDQSNQLQDIPEPDPLLTALES